MHCSMCHGWMEQRYHPDKFKRKKNCDKEHVAMLEKKINNKDSNKEKSRISIMVDEKMS